MTPIRALHDTLLAHYGPQGWWPAQTPFEVMVGAILTQNTAWTNVERAISHLYRADALCPQRLLTLDAAALAELIRPSGYFNVKARRLQAFCRWLLDQGGETALRRWPTEALREGLLSVNGVGPETADDMLLYALDRPVFVIDAYTRRIFARLRLATGEEPYDHLRQQVETALDHDIDRMQALHALLVAHAKAHCRRRPQCHDCPLHRPAAQPHCAGLAD